MIQGRIDTNEQTLFEKEQLIRALLPGPENDPLKQEALVFLCRFIAFLNPARAVQLAEELLAQRWQTSCACARTSSRPYA